MPDVVVADALGYKARAEWLCFARRRIRLQGSETARCPVFGAVFGLGWVRATRTALLWRPRDA